MTKIYAKHNDCKTGKCELARLPPIRMVVHLIERGYAYAPNKPNLTISSSEPSQDL